MTTKDREKERERKKQDQTANGNHWIEDFYKMFNFSFFFFWFLLFTRQRMCTVHCTLHLNSTKYKYVHRYVAPDIVYIAHVWLYYKSISLMCSIFYCSYIIFFLLSIWSKPNKKIKEPTNEKKRKIGEMFKLSLCLIYPLTPLGIASFSGTVLLFSRFMWRLHSYLISREQNKMRKKMWGKKIRIYQTALSSFWKISFDARCTMHILCIICFVHFFYAHTEHRLTRAFINNK